MHFLTPEGIAVITTAGRQLRTCRRHLVRRLPDGWDLFGRDRCKGAGEYCGRWVRQVSEEKVTRIESCNAVAFNCHRVSQLHSHCCDKLQLNDDH